MYFPKSKSIITLFIFLFLSGSNLYTQESLIITSDSSSYSFNNYKLDLLVKNDSLYKATLLLNESINFSKKYNLIHTEANAYNALGSVLAKMSNFRNAENYHKKALRLFDSIGNKKGRDISLSGLLNTYVLEKNYIKFDSIYPEAQKTAKTLNSETYFVNLDNKIKKEYYNLDNESMFNFSEAALSTLDTTDFEKLNYSKNYREKNLKENLLQSYKYSNALAKIKTDNYDAKSFDRLFSIDENKLKASLNSDINSYRKLASLNYYKYLYYTNSKKNLDSANKYLLKSDTYKYDGLLDVEAQNSRNGNLVYKIIDAEQQLNLANEIRKEDAKTSLIFYRSTIVMSILLMVTLSIIYFYFIAKKNVAKINKTLQKTNNKLIAIDKNRLEFFSILSHELRTPIYGITGLATLIDQEKDPIKKQDYLDSLISSSTYISTLIDNILQANKLKFEQKNLHLKPAKIKHVIDHVISTVEVAAKNKDLQLITQIDTSDDDEFILIDKIAFSQILINLVYNAIRYTTQGHIKISVILKKRTQENVTLRFEIADTGIGIKEENRSVIFNAFENKTFLNKNSSGSGLGLFIVKTLLKSHNTDIDFVSKPNKGTTFFFETSFKIIKEEFINKISVHTPERLIHVLVVDDNKINLLITTKNIEKIANHECETSSNGKEAITLIKQNDFDLILMDINMPDMDGFEVTKHIRMFNTKTPIIALTALNSSEILLKAQASGINQIITKPYVFEDFKAIILSYTDTAYYKPIESDTK